MVFDGGHEDPVFTGQPDGRNLDFEILQFLFKLFCRFRGTHPLKMGGIADFHPVIVNVQIDQIGSFAAKDYFVVPGVFQFRSKETAEQGV